MDIDVREIKSKENIISDEVDFIDEVDEEIQELNTKRLCEVSSSYYFAYMHHKLLNI